MAFLTRPTTYDIVVIGNGSVGMSLANRLKTRDDTLRIAVVGPAARTGGASVTAGAMINAWAEVGYGVFDNPALGERAELSIQSLPMWEEVRQELAEFTPDDLGIAWGTYILNNAMGSPHETRAVDYIIDAMAKRQVPHQVMSASDVPWLKPEPRGQITRIVRVPDGRFDPFKVLGAYEKAARARRIEMIDDRAVALDLAVGRRSVRLADGTVLDARQIVLANGSFAQALIDGVPDLRHAMPRLLWGAGSALDVTLPDWVKKYGGIDRSILDIDHVVRSVDRGGACGLHLVPHGDGEYYCGASAGVWFDPEPKARVHAIHVLLRGLVEEIHKAFFFAGISIRGPGFRPTTIDAFPLLGESNIEGVWLANGMKRDGFTCSPLIANELSSAMLGGQSRLPERFKPVRKLISYKTKAKAIDDHVDGDIGGEFQHGLYLPPYAHAGYREARLHKTQRVYEMRGITDFGIHPEMLHLYENDEFFAAIDHGRESVAG
jgi:glycine/D-amino acid oxidase-like deaminating enzyme